jgi:2-phospho-L-lactate guanylyltransferase
VARPVPYAETVTRDDLGATAAVTPGAPVAVLVPVKAFSEAKLRLAPAVGPAERARLARVWATHVLSVAAPLPVTVVCDDAEVAVWAAEAGARVAWAPGRGLNRAVESGVAQLRDAGVGRVIVAHGDLPLAGDLGWVARFPGVTIVPDHGDDGTNVISVSTAVPFRFAYGAGSFRRHGAEARRLGLALRVVRDPLLGRDIDLPSDLAALCV